MQPYIIKQGDYLALLAYTFGFDAETVWNDSANADLQRVRSDPNVLWATDIVQIPDQTGAPPPPLNVTTGTTNTFVTDIPSPTLTLRFTDPRCASQACTVQELPELTGLTTDSNGVVSFPVAVTQQTVTVQFTDGGMTFPFQVGYMDPINTLSGIFQRLQNLGFIDVNAPFSPPNLDLMRTALRAFRGAQPGATLPPSDSNSPGPSLSARGSQAPPSSAAPPSSRSGPASSGTTDGSPASSGPTSSPPSSGSAQDDAGLNDDGTLDDTTSRQLVAAHGS
jgi:hypothetical protein